MVSAVPESQPIAAFSATVSQRTAYVINGIFTQSTCERAADAAVAEYAASTGRAELRVGRAAAVCTRVPPAPGVPGTGPAGGIVRRSPGRACSPCRPRVYPRIRRNAATGHRCPAQQLLRGDPAARLREGHARIRPAPGQRASPADRRRTAPAPGTGPGAAQRAVRRAPPDPGAGASHLLRARLPHRATAPPR